MINRLREVFDAEVRLVSILAATGFLQTFMQTADVILKALQVAIGTLTLIYLMVKLNRYLVRPNKKQSKGEE